MFISSNRYRQIPYLPPPHRFPIATMMMLPHPPPPVLFAGRQDSSKRAKRPPPSSSSSFLLGVCDRRRGGKSDVYVYCVYTTPPSGPFLFSPPAGFLLLDLAFFLLLSFRRLSSLKRENKSKKCCRVLLEVPFYGRKKGHVLQTVLPTK